MENRDDAAGPGVGVISVVRLSRDLTTGTITRTITDADFDVPTTIARSGGRNYVVNASVQLRPRRRRTSYEVVKVPKR